MKTSFAQWLDYTGLSIKEAAKLLGITRNRVAAYKKGQTTAPVMPAVPDRRTRFAMAAIAFGVEEWPEQNDLSIYLSQEFVQNNTENDDSIQ